MEDLALSSPVQLHDDASLALAEVRRQLAVSVEVAGVFGRDPRLLPVDRSALRHLCAPVPFTLSDTAIDLVAVLDALDVDRAHVLGLSFGGGIAQTAAVCYPERFASLSLLATTDTRLAAFEGRARSGEVDGMEAQVVPSLTRWFRPAALAGNAWGVRYGREHLRRDNAVDWAASWRASQGLHVHGSSSASRSRR